MKMKRILKCLLLAGIGFGFQFWTGCATTGSYTQEQEIASGEETEIDKLLGGEESGEESLNEDDVLRLLGINKESETTEEMAMGSRTPETQAPSQLPATQAEKKETEPASTVPPTWRSDSYTERYQEALQAYRSKKYQEAIEKFNTLLATNPRHHLADNCQYWIGEAYYDLGNYQQALMAFEKVFTFPNSNKNDSAQLKIGLCYMKLNDNQRALQELQKFVSNYPSSEYIGIAKQKIAELEGKVSSE